MGVDVMLLGGSNLCTCDFEVYMSCGCTVVPRQVGQLEAPPVKLCCLC